MYRSGHIWQEVFPESSPLAGFAGCCVGSFYREFAVAFASVTWAYLRN
jgi:hypothetical protein